jgi:hypothetical protein
MTFDSASLATVGYAHVKADGSTPDCNSGLIIARTGAGVYTVSLPPVGSDVQTLQQIDDRVFFVVTSYSANGPLVYWINNTSPNVRTIHFDSLIGGFPMPTDSPFQLIVQRTIIP